MDVIRRCYTTKMRFFEDSDVEIPVTWYFASPDAEVMPFWTRFGSGNQAREKELWQGPGEASWRPRPWSDGLPPGPYAIELFSSLALEKFTGSTGPLTTLGGFASAAGQVTIAYIYFFRISGPSSILAVQDSNGVDFVKDWEDTNTVEARVGLSVWRGRSPVSNPNNRLTITFTGSILYITIAADQFTGMMNDPPVVIVPNQGLPADPIKLPKFKTVLGDNLCLTLWSSNNASAQASGPSGFQERNHSTTAGSFEDGSAWSKFLTGKKIELDCQWAVTHLGHWVAAGLVYKGTPRFLPPGKTFCGTQDAWQGGADIGERFLTDVFGRGPCCGPDFPFLLTCPEQDQELTLTIDAIYNQGPTSLAFPGMKLRFLPNGNPEQWEMAPEDKERLGFTWDSLPLFPRPMDCLIDRRMVLWQCQANYVPKLCEAGAFAPPRLVWKFFQADFWGPPATFELWDFHVTWDIRP